MFLHQITSPSRLYAATWTWSIGAREYMRVVDERLRDQDVSRHKSDRNCHMKLGFIGPASSKAQAVKSRYRVCGVPI